MSDDVDCERLMVEKLIRELILKVSPDVVLMDLIWPICLSRQDGGGHQIHLGDEREGKKEGGRGFQLDGLVIHDGGRVAEAGWM